VGFSNNTLKPPSVSFESFQIYLFTSELRSGVYADLTKNKAKYYKHGTALKEIERRLAGFPLKLDKQAIPHSS